MKKNILFISTLFLSSLLAATAAISEQLDDAEVINLENMYQQKPVEVRSSPEAVPVPSESTSTTTVSDVEVEETETVVVQKKEDVKVKELKDLMKKRKLFIYNI